MLRKRFTDLFYKAQQNRSCHPKYQQLLLNLYRTTSKEDFLDELVKCLTCVFVLPMYPANPAAERTLEFATGFLVQLISISESLLDDIPNDNENDRFISSVIDEVLEYHDAENDDVRYRVVQFVMIFLQKTPEGACLMDSVWTSIENAMLERMEDKAPIRIQATKCLVKLQQPTESNCPVIATYLSHIHDINPFVRKEIVQHIHPNEATIPMLIERLCDTDPLVRLAGYKKFHIVGPLRLKLGDRQQVLLTGFGETISFVKEYFINKMLPAWLTAFNGDFLAFLNGLNVDADEYDVRQTDAVCEKVLKVFFESTPLTEIIDDLSLSNDKLIPAEELTVESVILWSNLVKHVQELQESEEDYLELILPELFPFTIYLEKIFRSSSNKEMETWEILAHKQILQKLLQIMKTYDFSEEVGRRAARKLVSDIIMTEKLNKELLVEIIDVFGKLFPNVDQLTEEVVHLVRELRIEEIKEHVPPTQDQQFRLAQTRVNINICQDDIDSAVANRDFETASKFQEIKKALGEKQDAILAEVNQVVVKKVVRDDPETICRYLDVLIQLLSMPNLKKLPSCLAGFKEESIDFLLNIEDTEVFWRALKCVALFALLDKQTAVDNAKLFYSPLYVYYTSGKCEKSVLLVSISAVTDLMRIHSSSVFSTKDDECEKAAGGSAKRNLHRDLSDEDLEVELQNINSTNIVDMLIELLDDEDEDIAEMVTKGLYKLALTGVVSSSNMISRMILTWINPVIEQEHPRVSQQLIQGIMHFAHSAKNSDEVLEKAVVPVLTTLGNAPKTSPLKDANTNDIISFLAGITSLSNRPHMFVKSHYNIARLLCDEIAADPTGACVPLYIKMLQSLNISFDDVVANEDLCKCLEHAQAGLVNKLLQNKISKIAEMLKTGNKSATVTQYEAYLSASSQTSGMDQEHRADVSERKSTKRNDDKNKRRTKRRGCAKRGRNALKKNVQNGNQRLQTISNNSTTSTEVNEFDNDSTRSSSSSPHGKNYEDVKQEILSGTKLLRVHVTRINSTELGSKQKRKSK